MAKYIDAEKLVAELTKMQFTLNAAYRKPQSDNIVRAISLEYDDIFSLIDSLQQEQQAVEGVVHHLEKANYNYLEVDSDKVTAVLREFSEGDKVYLVFCKEEKI